MWLRTRRIESVLVDIRQEGMLVFVSGMFEGEGVFVFVFVFCVSF